MALRNVSFVIEEGCSFGLLGRNGAGKTTVLKLLTELLRPQRGALRILGHDVSSESLESRSSMAYLPEENPSAQSSWTTQEYLRFFGRLQGLTRNHLRKAIRETSESLDMLHLLRRNLVSLSYGERRRVEVCRCLVTRPSVLLLDEPTKGFDIPSKGQMWELLKRLRRVEGVTILLCSHDIQEIETLCDSVGVLRVGKIVFRGPLGELAVSYLRIRATPVGRAVRVLAASNLEAISLGGDDLRVEMPPGQSSSQLLALLAGNGVAISDFRTDSNLSNRLSSLM